MTVEGVFDIGVAGMGPALTPKGEAVVNAKMERQNRVLDDLASRGVNIAALTHRHHGDCGRTCGSCAEACSTPETAEPSPQTLEEARELIARQKGQLEHLRHQVAVQQNQILLLREALGRARATEADKAPSSPEAAAPAA